MTDCKNLELAREWAEWMHDNPDVYGGTSDRARAAADLISSLPDEWVDADELRKYIAEWREGLATAPRDEYEDDILDGLEDMLPALPAPESAAPRPEDMPVGEPWQVEVYGKAAIGYRNDPESRLCWAVVFRDDANRDWVYDSDVTLIARLVPETTEQPETEQEFDPAYTYRDRDGDKWLHQDGAWRWASGMAGKVSESGHYKVPPAEYGPYTRIEDTK